MKKAMEFWIFREDIKLMNLHHHVIGPNGVHLKEDSTALERPEEWIHVREVLDPDPRDETIKIMREAIDSAIQQIVMPHKTMAKSDLDRYCNRAIKIIRRALEAVEKLEK